MLSEAKTSLVNEPMLILGSARVRRVLRRPAMEILSA